MAQPIYELRKFTKNTTMTITIKEAKEFKVRRWIACQLLKLAALTLGCGIEIID